MEYLAFNIVLTIAKRGYFCSKCERKQIEWKVLQRNINFSTEAVNGYNHSVNEYGLLPSEYLVWHALVIACSSTDNEKTYCYAVTIAEIARVIKIQRETVKRAVVKLEKNGLAKQVNDRWIFLSADMD